MLLDNLEDTGNEWESKFWKCEKEDSTYLKRCKLFFINIYNYYSQRNLILGLILKINKKSRLLKRRINDTYFMV